MPDFACKRGSVQKRNGICAQYLVHIQLLKSFKLGLVIWPGLVNKPGLSDLKSVKPRLNFEETQYLRYCIWYMLYGILCSIWYIYSIVYGICYMVFYTVTGIFTVLYMVYGILV